MRLPRHLVPRSDRKRARLTMTGEDLATEYDIAIHCLRRKTKDKDINTNTNSKYKDKYKDKDAGYRV